MNTLPNGSTRTYFKDAKPGDLYWSIDTGDWHIIRTVEHLPSRDPLFNDSYRITCAGTLNAIVAAGAPFATLEP